MSKNLTRKDEQAVTCSMCKKPVPVLTTDNTPGCNTSLHTYLTPCSHVLCHICYVNTKHGKLRCKACPKMIDHKEVIRVYFTEVSGPLSKEIRDAHDRVEEMKRDLAEWRESDKKLRDRVDEIGAMVEEERKKLQELVDEANAILPRKTHAAQHRDNN
ncbi:unnamed protein product [Rhizoctonia solani]|uniref:RING-type domain-containing protein n=1 Tax=Rhizoctonia solani TaxID=456999 RepID=A0A8H3HWR2_9AGAM|nr:unnamed protein product [Rhizoctonia solani]